MYFSFTFKWYSVKENRFLPNYRQIVFTPSHQLCCFSPTCCFPPHLSPKKAQLFFTGICDSHLCQHTSHRQLSFLHYSFDIYIGPDVLFMEHKEEKGLHKKTEHLNRLKVTTEKTTENIHELNLKKK